MIMNMMIALRFLYFFSLAGVALYFTWPFNYVTWQPVVGCLICFALSFVSDKDMEEFFGFAIPFQIFVYFTPLVLVATALPS